LGESLLEVKGRSVQGEIVLRLFLLFTQLGVLERGKVLIPVFYKSRKNNEKSGELCGFDG
jgi:hypothetical protein